MALRLMRFSRIIALSVLVSSFSIPTYSSAADTPTEFEPPLRDLWARGSERFQRQWLVAGPIAASAAADIDPASLRLAPGEALTASDGSVRWAPHTSWSDVVDLNTIGNRAPQETNVDRFVFAATAIKSAEAGPMELSIGSERPYSVWLNGKLVHTREAADVFSPDRDRVPVEMNQGDNAVVLRFRETSAGPSQFSVRAVHTGTRLSKIQEIAPSVQPSNDGTLAVRTHFEIEKDAPPVLVQVVRAGGAIAAEKRVTRGEVARFDTKSWPQGAYEIRTTTQNAWNERSVRHLAWYKGDASEGVRRLLEAAEKADNTPRGDSIRMLAAMAKDRLGGSIENLSSSAWRLVHSPLMEFEELELDAQKRTGRVRGGGFVRLAYTDDIDGSTQFCRAFLPLDYTKDKRWPLVAALHGYNPANPEYIGWWSVDERHAPVSDVLPTIYVEPHGRGNAQYLGIGDRDVMRCIAEAKQLFSVDEDRVYLTGESMGGHGTWVVASRHPDVFAAAAPVYGGWDFRITNVSSVVNVPPPTTQLSAYGFERASSFANAENLLNVPLLVVHGDADAAVHVENSRHAVKLLQRWGYNVRYHEMPGWAHEDLGQRVAIADWLLTHRRQAAPRTVRLRSPDLAGASAYWVSARAIENPAEIIRVHAQVLEPGVVRIDSTNVASLALELPEALRASSGALEVIWNGKRETFRAKDGRATLGSVPRTALYKRPGVEGPLPAVIATPFAVVVGTTSSDERMREMIQKQADAFARLWLEWQKQPLRVLKDTEVSQAQERTYSLILFGDASANAVTKRFANALPFNVSSNEIAVDGQKFALTDSVLQAIYPSPSAADRYVYVVAATSPDGMYFWRPQLVNFVQGNPLTSFDWVIQDGRRAPSGTTDPSTAYVAAGVFDASWRQQDRHVQRRDGAASKWTLRRAPAKDFAPSASALEAAVGQYELFPGFALMVRVEGPGIVIDIPGEPSIHALAESDWIYVDVKTGNTIEFVRDDTGKVVGASADAPQGVLFLKKL